MKDRRNRIQAIINYLEEAAFREREDCTGVETALTGYGIPETFPPLGADWHGFECGDTWGGSDCHQLFKCRIPSRPDKPLAILLRTDSIVRWSTDNPQVLVYLDGELRATMDVNHNMVVLSECCDDKPFDLGFYAYVNSRGGRTSFFSLQSAVPSFPVMELLFDMKNIFEAADLLEKDDEERVRAFRALEDAIDVLDTRSLPLLDESVPAARATLALYMSKQRESGITVHSVGSTHIDVAWRWPLRQTKEKAVRSALTALNLMDHYPDFRFLLTQPQLYEFIREQRPDIFSRIKERIREGRWEAEGGMWLESDSVLASGESLVRQLVYGKRYISSVLEAPESEILWLPDAFGFNGNLPQIMKKAGIRYFMTTKISWSDTHIFPYDIFSWRGIDGSEVLSYFISTRNYDSSHRGVDFRTTYNGAQDASQIMGTWQRFQDKDVTEDVLTCFGYGDGGGGPTYEMLENTKRLQHSIASCPRTVMTSAHDFFTCLERKLLKKPPIWTGELYFEYHRGTLTSISEEKKWNRVIEDLTHDAEALATISSIEWPEAKLERVWKTILLNQFHDILPGSAIDEVYEEAFKEYEEAAAEDRSIIAASLASLSSGSLPAVVNTTSHIRTSLLVSEEPVACCEGQQTYDGKYLYLAENVPSYGIKTLAGNCKPDSDVLQGNASCFETPYYRVTIDADGCISSLFDKECAREVIREGGKGNSIISYEDRPLRFDNWNTEEYYREKPYPWECIGEVKIVENGPLRAVLEVTRKSLSSCLVQHIVFYAHTRRVDFISSLNWDGDHLLVKAEFPVDVHSYSADYGIQFGSVTRSATSSTDWDSAQFEVPALGWSDLSEPGYGVSLLADSRYGFSVKDGVMTLSLLKSGTSPAENADRGHHEFTYSIFPHAGTWREGRTVMEKEDLTRPLYILKREDPCSWSFAFSDHDNVIIDTIKRSEDGKAIVLRVYDAYGMRTECRLSFDRSYRISETDLLERNPHLLASGDSLERTFKPYEIVTLYLES